MLSCSFSGGAPLGPMPDIVAPGSQLHLQEEAVDVGCAVVPEEHDLALRDPLAAVHHELHYVVKMPERSEAEIVTYLLLCGSFLGLMSSCLNQAK